MISNTPLNQQLPSRRHRKRQLPRRILAATAAVLVAAGLASACNSQATGTKDGADGPPVKGGNLTVRIAQDPGSLDAVKNTNAGVSYISHEVFEQLVTIDKNYQPQPVLAESYKKSDDGLAFTFTLRQGVTFSDGTPLKAADVVASLKYWVENGSYAGSLKPVLKDVTAKDDATVEVSLKRPFNLIALMAASAGSEIHKAADIAASGPTGIPNERIIGTGPYKVKSWTRGQQIVLERNTNYKPPKGPSSGYAGAKRAFLDTITYKIVADEDAVLNGLKTGLWDVAEPSHDQYDQIKNDAQLKIKVEAAANVQYVALNHNSGSIFSKAEARDAMNLLIDKKAIMAAQGVPELTQPSNGAFATQTNKNLYSDAGKAKWEQNNPEQAKQMFAAAGLRPDQTIRMITTDEFPQFKDALLVIQNQLKKIGIKSSIESYDFATLMGRKNNKPNSWDVLALMDDGNPPVPSYTDNVNGLDNSGYPRDKLAPLLEAYDRATTPEEAKRAVDAIQGFTSQNLPTITLYMAKNYVAHRPNVGGYDGWGMEFADVWIKK
ncbi:peptide/nickel transport system substrate-binding protein [Actinomadura pelletieri DSM 43383]|uniref:Peptide/nickel transport system substrate-binding protein n=1 Tax=Actinomadura pelletieri DSM 43383 TaxID=1120940 RepID=A0A495QUC7_9ACTN|nr:ABC transporter substrate-binding protein [Actinomadura pelletieri]RKS77023.1 peptide/nickel transport system substrate-binding protein [Actinomadura pelletieri DSM 43383]